MKWVLHRPKMEGIWSSVFGTSTLPALAGAMLIINFIDWLSFRCCIHLPLLAFDHHSYFILFEVMNFRLMPLNLETLNMQVNLWVFVCSKKFNIQAQKPCLLELRLAQAELPIGCLLFCNHYSQGSILEWWWKWMRKRPLSNHTPTFLQFECFQSLAISR